jgi:hypothetical protein
MDISFYCYKCGQHIVIDLDGAGIFVNCPQCATPLPRSSESRIPSSSSPLNIEAPIGEPA